MPVDHSAYKQNVEQIRQIAEKMGGDVLGKEGWILYSSYTTLVRGEYYFLGINPAGSGEVKPKTVQDSLDEMVQDYLDGLTGLTDKAGKNQFLEIPWNGSKFLPLQERFKFLFESALRIDDPRTVCASNLVFLSRKKAKDLSFTAYVSTGLGGGGSVGLILAGLVSAAGRAQVRFHHQ